MSVETLDVIARRYSCRSFQDRPVPLDLLRTVAEAGVRAPSAVNRQPWRLTVVTDQTEVAEIGRVGLDNLKVTDEAGYSRILSRGGLLAYNAPAMIIVSTATGPSDFPVAMDAGIVAAHLALAATAVGLDTCIAAMPRLAFSGQSGQALKDTYIPEGFEFAICVLLGYAAQPGGAQHQPDLTKITYL